MKKILSILLFALSLYSSAHAQSALEGTSWGALAISASGDTLLDVRSSDRFVPASNVKIFTSGAGFMILGPDFKWDTNLAYTGSIDEDGVLDGDIYIIGGGDPTTGAGPNADATFAEWMDLLVAKGIRKINGNIIGDGRYYDGAAESATWQSEDLGFYYGKGAEALNFYKNAQDLTVSAGAGIGTPVGVKASYPQLPWMEFSHTCTTGEAGSGDKLYYYNTDLCPKASMRGTLGLDIKSKLKRTSNRFPAYTCAYFFYRYVQQHGIMISGCYADINPSGYIRTDLDGTSPEKAEEWSRMKNLGSAYSMQLSQVIQEMMQTSDNFYAQAVFRAIGLDVKGHTDFESCSAAMEEFMSESLGLDISGFRIKDGNGLSRADFVSPEFTVSFLKAMMGSGQYDAFFKSFPQPGLGTLASNLNTASRDLRARVRMKSGSMDGVRCYSGYILSPDGDKDKTIIFSIFVNNATAPSMDVSRAIDAMIVKLDEQC